MIIERQVEKQFFGHPEIIFEDQDSGEKFSRLIGGMAWPGIRPGYVVILAEDAEKDKALGRKKIFVVDEYENLNLSDLLRRCAEFSVFYKVQRYFGDTKDIANMQRFNRSGERFSLVEAPFSDSADGYRSYLNLIRELTVIERKALYFGKGSKLPGILSSLHEDNVPRSRDAFYSNLPAVAALGFALSGLEYRQIDPREEERVMALNASLCSEGDY